MTLRPSCWLVIPCVRPSARFLFAGKPESLSPHRHDDLSTAALPEGMATVQRPEHFTSFSVVSKLLPSFGGMTFAPPQHPRCLSAPSLHLWAFAASKRQPSTGGRPLLHHGTQGTQRPVTSPNRLWFQSFCHPSGGMTFAPPQHHWMRFARCELLMHTNTRGVVGFASAPMEGQTSRGSTFPCRKRQVHQRSPSRDKVRKHTFHTVQ